MYTISDQCGQRIDGTPLWNINSSSLGRPWMNTISDHCVHRNRSTSSGMRLVVLELHHECILSMTAVVSELGALLKERYEFLLIRTVNVYFH